MRRTVLVVVLLAIGACVGTWLSLQFVARQSRIDGEWTAICARADGEVAGWRTAAAESPRFLGPAVPGDAWDRYLPAFSKIDNLLIGMSLHECGTEPASWLEHPSLVEELRTAARSETVAVRVMRAQKLYFKFNSAVLLLLGSARGRMEHGDLDGAIDDIAACFQVCADLSRELYGAYDGFQGATRATHALEVIVLSARAEPRHLTRALGLLRAAEARFPSGSEVTAWEYYAGTLAFLRAYAEGRVTWESQFDKNTDYRSITPEPSTRQYGFSRKMLVARLDDLAMQKLRIVQRAEQLPWNQAESLLMGFQHSLSERGHPLFNDIWDCTTRQEERRFFAAHMRLVQAAVLVRQGLGPGAAEWPLDAYTLEPIELVKKPGHVELQSRRPDGHHWRIPPWPSVDFWHTRCLRIQVP